MASALVQVKNGGGAWVDVGPSGINVTNGNLISVRLKTPGPVVIWNLKCFGVDENTSIIPGLSDVSVIDNQVTTPSTTVTFTMPAGDDVGRALVFRSAVDGGGSGLTVNFGIYSLTIFGTRVGAVNETREGNADFGWAAKINPLIRSGGGGGVGQITLPMADSNQNLTVGQISTAGMIKTTGPLTADRTLFLPAPVGDADSYLRPIRNLCTGFNLVVSTGVGTTVSIGPGLSALLLIDTFGVDRGVTGV